MRPALSREERERQRTEPRHFSADEARPRLAAYLAAFPEARAAYLFGSRARGRVRPSSDVDIAVWVDPATEPGRRADLRWEWVDTMPDALEYPGDIDVVILNDAPPALAWEVARRPVVLWEAEPGLASERAFRLRQMYRDELPRLERRRERLLQRIERGEFGGGRRQG